MLRCIDETEKKRLVERFAGKLILLDSRERRGQNVGHLELLSPLAWEEILAWAYTCSRNLPP